MWIVAKVKKNNLDLFCSQFQKKITDIQYYFPKINGKDKAKQNLLVNYIFCYNPLFKKKSILNIYKTIKGLDYFLDTKEKDQKDIEKFINFCKKNEDEDGNITNSFFRKDIIDKGKFITGPFSNYLFNIIKKEKKNVSVLVGDITISISNKSKVLYQPV